MRSSGARAAGLRLGVCIFRRINDFTSYGLGDVETRSRRGCGEGDVVVFGELRVLNCDTKICLIEVAEEGASKLGFR